MSVLKFEPHEVTPMEQIRRRIEQNRDIERRAEENKRGVLEFERRLGVRREPSKTTDRTFKDQREMLEHLSTCELTYAMIWRALVMSSHPMSAREIARAAGVENFSSSFSSGVLSRLAEAGLVKDAGLKKGERRDGTTWLVRSYLCVHLSEIPLDFLERYMQIEVDRRRESHNHYVEQIHRALEGAGFAFAFLPRDNRDHRAKRMWLSVINHLNGLGMNIKMPPCLAELMPPDDVQNLPAEV